MRSLSLLAALLLLFSSFSFAELNLAPYLYPSEDGATIDYVSFASSAANSTVKIVEINGEEALILMDERMVTDRAQISDILNEYYKKNYYPSSGDFAALAGDADAFNRSRNYVTRYGPAEKTCRAGGTFLDYKPCKDIGSCTQTASLVCTITGAEGCRVDLLATYILDYKKAIDKLDDGYGRFLTSYNLLAPGTLTTAFSDMESALSTMKEGADQVAKSKLRFPEAGFCGDCLGVCPEAHFDYAALSAVQGKIDELQEKTAPYAKLEATIDKVIASTDDRIRFRAGEEKAIIFAPKLKSSTLKFSGLKAQATEARALVSDSSFVTAADSFLNKGEELEQKFAKREFDGFETLLSAYETSGRTLTAMINNSTSAYRTAAEAQDSASDKVLEAQWSVNRLSKSSVDSYNSLAERKNKLDAAFKPPMSSSQYLSLAESYRKVTSDAKAYLAASSSVQTSIFSAGNALGRTSVDGAMSLVSSMTPVSFKTRKSVATFVPPLVLAVIDLSVLAIGLLVFVGLFYYFHGFFKNRIAASGWALTFLFFVFVLIVGSGAFYAIVMSTEQYTSFAEFFDTYKTATTVSVVVEESGAPQDAISAMRACADQIAEQSALLGKKTYKYYIQGSKCTSVIPKAVSANNSTSITYEAKTNLVAADCLDRMPDVPVFDLYYSAENKPPTFTTVVTKSATFKYNEATYGKEPLCPIADILD